MNRSIQLVLTLLAVASLGACASTPADPATAAKRKANRDTFFSILDAALQGAADYQLSKPKKSTQQASAHTYKPTTTYASPSTSSHALAGSSGPAASYSVPARPNFSGEGYYANGAMYNGVFVGSGTYYSTNRYWNCLSFGRVQAGSESRYEVRNGCADGLKLYHDTPALKATPVMLLGHNRAIFSTPPVNLRVCKNDGGWLDSRTGYCYRW